MTKKKTPSEESKSKKPAASTITSGLSFCGDVQLCAPKIDIQSVSLADNVMMPSDLKVNLESQASNVAKENSTTDLASPPPIGPEIGPDPRNTKNQVKFEEIPLLEGPDGIRFDFAFGFRVYVPENAPQKKYQISFYDSDSGMLLDVFEIAPGQHSVGDRKYYVRYRMVIEAAGKKIFDYIYDCTGQRVYIIVPDGGLGDNLAWVPLVAEFQRVRKADVTCVCGEWMARLVGDLYPELTFIPCAGNPRLTGAYANYFCGIFGKELRSWYPVEHQQLGMQGSVEAILGLAQQPMKCRLHRGSKRPFPEPFVCISTMATNPGKYWNFEGGWNTIIRWLKSCGYRVIDIDRDPQLYFANKKYTIPSEAEDFTGLFPIQERINLLEHADFFIGLPSGLSWLAWELDIPVVMISGFTMPVSEFPTPYRVTNFLFCHGCWNDSNCFFDSSVPVWCPRHLGTPREIECTKVITPKMVRDAIMRIPEFQRQIAKSLPAI